MFVHISTLFHAFLSSTASLLFLIVRWIFCLKYLIIAREMPGLFKGEVANFESTGRYKCYRLFVTVLFCLVTLWNTLNTYRWLMEVYMGNPEKNQTLAYNFIASYFAANVILQMIPMVIFGVALSKIRKFADSCEDQTLVMN